MEVRGGASEPHERPRLRVEAFHFGGEAAELGWTREGARTNASFGV
jgi:hypothetical protein